MAEANHHRLAVDLGQAIARQRLRCKLTQDQVAEALKIGPEAVSRMERGIVTPSLPRLFELATLFGCEASDLLRDSSPLPNDQAQRIRGQLERLSVEDRTLVVSLVDQLCERLGRQGSAPGSGPWS